MSQEFEVLIYPWSYA